MILRSHPNLGHFPPAKVGSGKLMEWSAASTRQ
jgi:hypothetical protein